MRRQALEDIRAAQATHAGLWLDKFYYAKECTKESDYKRYLADQVTQVAEPPAYKSFYENRWLPMLGACGAVWHDAEVRGRMVVGLGAESVLENSIALHRTYGVPYIPGTALKGLARRFAKRVSDWTPKHSLILFGNEKTEDNASAGYVTFFDALYVPGTGGKSALREDVMTVHHPKYYMSADVPPADWDDPTPIPFISATGKYLVALSASDIEEPTRTRWLDAAFKLLKLALAEEGIGAKTSSGYGRMQLET